MQNATEIRDELERILKAEPFSKSPKRAKFLEYVVLKKLDNRLDDLSALQIAIHLYGKTDSYDPNSDNIVRVNASRVRESLDIYYLRTGFTGPIAISLPRGGYEPMFEVREPPKPEPVKVDAVQPHPEISAEATVEPLLEMAPEPQALPEQATSDPRQRNWLVAAVVPFVSLLIFAGIYQLSGTRAATSMTAVDEPPIIAIGQSRFVTMSDRGGELQANAVHRGFQAELEDQLNRFKNVRAFSEDNSRIDVDNSELRFDYRLTTNAGIMNDVVLVRANLRKAGTDEIVWREVSRHPVETAGSIARIQANIAARVAVRLEVADDLTVSELLKEAVGQSATQTEAYFCMLAFRGKQVLGHVEGYEAVQSCLEETVTVEAANPKGQAALAWIYLHRSRAVDSEADRKWLLSRAVDFSRAAHETGENLAFVHYVSALIAFEIGDPEAFSKDMETAVRLAPKSSFILASLGARLIQTDEASAGRQFIERAIAINPDYPSRYHWPLAVHEYLTKSGEDLSLHHANRYLQDDTLAGLILYTASLARKGLHKRAATEYRLLAQRYPDIEGNIYGYIDALGGSHAFAERLEQDLSLAGMGQLEAAEPPQNLTTLAYLEACQDLGTQACAFRSSR